MVSQPGRPSWHQKPVQSGITTSLSTCSPFFWHVQERPPEHAGHVMLIPDGLEASCPHDAGLLDNYSILFHQDVCDVPFLLPGEFLECPPENQLCLDCNGP